MGETILFFFTLCISLVQVTHSVFALFPAFTPPHHFPSPPVLFCGCLLHRSAAHRRRLSLSLFLLLFRPVLHRHNLQHDASGAMTAQSLLQKYELLNAHYPGERPVLGEDVKCVQCDGCDRVITFAVFHSNYDGGVDVCNMCRVAAQQNGKQCVTRADGKKRLCFAKHPLCFVGPAPLPERYVMDTDEVDVEDHPELLERRFKKSVDVIARRKKPRERPCRKSSSLSSSLAQPKTATSDRPRKTDGDDIPDGKARTRSGSRVTMVEEEAEEVEAVCEAAASPTLSTEKMLVEPEVAAEAQSEAGFGEGNHPCQGPTATELESAQQARCERIANGPVARFFLHIWPGTRVTASRPASLPLKPLVVVDHDKKKDFIVAPNTSCKTSCGFAGLTFCCNTLCVRIVPTLPELGLWFSVMCEEECFTRLDLWHCPVDVGAASSTRFVFADDALPIRKYSVEVGRQVAVSMGWLPVPLHRRDNKALGFCTFIRGQYLLSTLLPRDVASEPAAADGCVNVSTEICSATLIDRALELADVQWSTNGTSIAETFLFVVGCCTSVMVLRPNGDTRSGMLTLQQVHFIRAKGVAPYPPFVLSPPVVVGSMRGNHTMLVVSHGASVSCYRPPEFATKLFVALEDVVCSMQLHERTLTVGLANGAIVDVESGKVATVLQSPPLLINRVASTGTDDDILLVADASGKCQQTRIQHGTTLSEECIFSINRVQHERGQRLALSISKENGTMFSGSARENMVRFVQHPLRHLTEHCNPLLAFYPDGVWLLRAS